MNAEYTVDQNEVGSHAEHVPFFMRKRSVRAGCMMLLFAWAVPSLEARTLVWYNFNEGGIGETTTSPGEKTIVNAADTGDVYDGRVWTCTAKGKTGQEGWAATTTHVGTYAAAFPDGARVIDPQSGVAFTNDRCLYMDNALKTGYGSSPIVTVDATEELNVTNFTVELFVKFDQPEEEGTWRTLVMRSREKRNGADVWAIRVNENGKLNVRLSYYDDADAYKEIAALNNYGYVFDGKWHHIALVVNSDRKMITLYQDYQVLDSKAFNVDWVPYDGTDPIVIGNTLHATYGAMSDAWIDEFRFSDEALTPDQFLRLSVRPSSYVDDDTVVYLTFDTYSWFGNDMSGTKPLFNEAWGAASTNAILYCYTGTAWYDAGAAPGGGILRNSFFAEEVANSGALHLKTNNTPAMKSGGILIEDKNRRITSGSFTIEGFFRWKEYPTQTHYFVMEHSTNGQAIGFTMSENVKNGTRGKVKLHVIAGPAGTTYASSYTDDLVDDRWHHLAMTYDKTTQTVSYYCDYCCIGTYSGIGDLRVLPVSGTGGVGNTYENNLMIGTGYGMYHAYQMNDGLMDEIRVTARALEPDEFLRYHALPDLSKPTLAWFSFEDGSLVPEPAAEARGWSELSSTAHAFTSGAMSAGADPVLVCDGRGNVLREGNLHALSIPFRWNLRYLKDPLFEGCDEEGFTIEFFAKNTDAWAYGTVIELRGARVGHETDTFDVESDGRSRIICAIQTAYTNAYYRTQAVTDKSSNNAVTGDSGDIAVAKDGKWHHIAATFEPNSTGKKFCSRIYYDYRLITESTRDGTLRRNLVNTELCIGGAINGVIDEIRVSRGALAPEDFIRLRRQGFQIILR